MSEEFIKNLLGNINYEVETDTNWGEPLGLDRDTWKALLNYIQQKENIIKEVREDLDKQINFCTNEANGTINDKYCRIAINYLKHLKQELDKGE